MLEILHENCFLKDLKKMKSRGKNLKLYEVVELIATNQPLARKFHNHYLKGQWKDCLELHIEPDWLLIYKLDFERLILLRTGTHSDLFK
jgi:mRNA interferase YafQ